MAQIGRISGPLLEANLLRDGVDLAFRNDLDTVQLLYFDVNNGKIAVNRGSAAADLDVTDTTIQTVNLIADVAPIANYTISGNTVEVQSGDIFLNANEAIVLSNLETEDFYLSDNFIKSKDGENIELRPSGTGTLEVINDLKVYGDLHATGNITLEGNIIFGDTLIEDTVTFNADVDSDIIPSVTDSFSLGSATKRWNELYTLQINGEEISSSAAVIGGIDLVKSAEYTIYVATNGDNTNRGDHIQGPLATIREAIARIPLNNTDPYTIHVFPGVYAEELPLVIPANVTVVGNDLRNTIIVPAINNESKDVFHLNGETTVQNVTVKNFYYDSVNNTGHAFRFAPGAEIKTRSPYIQNVTVITKGTTVSASDPRGFVIGDAGRGAWIDANELGANTVSASMLFHSVTMITPNADAVTMTNGVRVEWLNSFTYFANRGLYAVNGAELRSIGSANIYGNIGAEADGDNTIMYLIGHNFAYIGTGKDVTNDNTLVDQTKETIELNNGRIYFSSTDHTGTFRVGENFFVDFERGTTSVDISTLTTNSLSGLVITTDTSSTTVTGTGFETGNIRFGGNLAQSLTGDLNLKAASDEINLLDSTAISGNLDIAGDFSYSGSLNIKGDEETDSLTFNVLFDQNFNPNQTLKFSLGSPSKKWLTAFLNRIEVGDFSVYDNVIETNVTNANLELRANGLGVINVTDNATFSNALDVLGTTKLNNNTEIQGSFGLVGSLTQTGNFSISSDLTVTQNITVGLSAQFEEILVDENLITTTSTNSDLELRASGNGTVNIETNLIVDQDVSADNIFAQSDVNITQTLTADHVQIADIEINDNYIQTVGADQSLTLQSDNNIFVPDNNVRIVQNLTVDGATDLQNLSATGALAHTGNRVQTGDYAIGGEFTNGNITIEDNFITAATDLELVASGDIIVPGNDVFVTNDLTVLGSSSLQSTTITTGLTHTGNRNQTGNYAIAGEFTNGNILVEDNFITTTIADTDLELRASGTGGILVPNNNVTFSQRLSVLGNTDLKSVQVTGTIDHTGNRNQTGNYAQVGNLTLVGNVAVDSDAQFTDIFISGNTLTTTIENNNLILVADGDGIVNFDDSVRINNNLLVQSITVQGDINIDQDLELEKISIPPSIIGIRQNYITTKISNADLELRASGTGTVQVPTNDVEIQNNLTVNGSTSLQSVEILGTVDHTGNRTQTGDYSLTGNVTVDGQAIISNRTEIMDIEIDQNTLKSTSGNLVLSASGTGLVTFSALTAEQNFSAGTLVAGNITINNTLALEVLESSTDIQIFDNVITTTNSNSNLELRASGSGSIWLQSLAFNTDTVSTSTTDITLDTSENLNISATGAVVVPRGTTAQRQAVTGNIRFNTDDNVFEAQGSTSTISFNGVYSSDRRTSVLAHPTNDSILFTVNQTQVGSVNADRLALHGLLVDSLTLDNNVISSSVNTDLVLDRDGTGELVIDDLSIKDNTIKNNGAALVLANTGFGYSKLATAGGSVIPAGTTAERPVNPPQLGDTRFNTEIEAIEVWDGSTYIIAAGTSATISQSEFNDLVLEYTLILG